jgi:hypothetical protein
MKVGVAPTGWPPEDSTDRLCSSGEALVNAIVTFPAFAVSDFVLYSSPPLGEAARLRALADPLDEGLEELVDGVVAAGASGVLAEEVVFEELPHPARATKPISAPSAASRLRARCVFACASG